MRVRFLVFFGILFGLFLPALAQEDSGLVLTIIGDPVTDDVAGTISVKFIVENDGIPVVDLTPDAVTLDEPIQSFNLSPANERQLHLAIAVDLSNGSDADLVQDSLRAFFDTYYLEKDAITVYILDAQVSDSESFREVEIDSLETAREMIEGLEMADQLFQTAPLIEKMFEDLQAVPDTLDNSRQVLFVGSFLNRPSDAEEAMNFADNNIKVHGVQAHRTREEFTRIYRGLTNNGGGLFANNFEGIFVIPGDSYQPINNLKVLYDTIVNSRVVYTLAWVSRNTSLNPERDVILQLDLPSGLQVEKPFTYVFNFRPPEIAFINLTSFEEVQRQVRRIDNQTIQFEGDVITVPVEVIFPDGVSRALDSISLRVIDMQTTETLQSYQLTSPPASSNNQYFLDWDLTGFVTPASEVNVELVVIVVDELNLQSEARTAGTVIVPAPPPTTTPVPTATPQPTITPLPSATPALFAVAGGALTGETIRVSLRNPFVWLLLGLIAFLLVTLILTLLRSQQVVREAAGSRAAVAAYPDTEPPAAPAVAPEEQEATIYAKLVPLDETGKLIGNDVLNVDKQEMTIGRSADCDLQFDLPFLDEHHCTLTVRNVANSYMIYIRDMSSTNGTFINGNRIRESEETQLPVRTEFSLTKQLEFKLLEADADLREEDRYSVVTRSTMASESGEQLQFKPFRGIEPREGSASDEPVDPDFSPI